MGKVVERKKKKKGRPSLLDLQKRNIREQQEQQQQLQQKHRKNFNSTSAPHSNPNYRTAPPDSSAHTPLRRSTRRNPNPDDADEDEDEDDDEDGVSDGKRREKKLKLVLKLPKSSANSASLNSGGSETNAEDDYAASETSKKRKINAIGDGSGPAHPQKVFKFWGFGKNRLDLV